MPVQFFTAEEAGVRLDVFLSEMLEEFSRSRIKNAIEAGNVSVNGTPVTKAGFALKQNDTVEIEIDAPKELAAVAQDLPIDIVYQDAHLAVINKAQGMVTHPALGTPDGTLVNALLYHIKDLSSINGVIRPGIVHRLDKDTSGLIVIAKTDAAHRSLSEQIEKKTAFRIYLALVDGNIKEEEGEIEAPLGRAKNDRKKIAVCADGRYARTHFTVLERFGQYTLVRFRLHTGRTHQIRVHAKHIKHPVVGDALYGGSNKFKLEGQLLHASELSFHHPETGERLTFTAPLPAHFGAVLERLKKLQSAENGHPTV